MIEQTARGAAVAYVLESPLPGGTLKTARKGTGDYFVRIAGPDIARALFVSLNTMRSHTKSIYAKLGVSSRRAAVAQAHDLNLLPDRRRS